MCVQCWQGSTGASITGLAGGYVTSEAHEEYLLHTFPGAVISFTAGMHRLEVGNAANAAAAASANAHGRLDSLRAEAQTLESSLNQLSQHVQVC